MSAPLSRRHLIAAGAVLTAGIGASVIFQNLPKPAQKVGGSPLFDAVLADPGSPRRGAGRPDVTIVLFTDYQCPICKVTDPALDRLLAADPGVAVIYKDWPIRGPMSDLAARVALAAHRQDRYAPVHTALMAATGRFTPERITEIATTAGCEPNRLAADLNGAAREIDIQINRHRAHAFGLGLQGTPSYLIGPYRHVGGLDDRALAAAVKVARAAA